MATTMFANFTSGDRRKKVYGKSARRSTLPPPLPDSNDDAPPSPDRPRKHPAALNGSLKKGGETLKASTGLENARARTDDVDVFDVPSDDDFMSRPKPAKKIVAKRRAPEAALETSTSSRGEAVVASKKPAKASQPLRKPDDANTATVKKTLPTPAQAPPPPSSDTIAPRTLRGKTPQPVGAQKQTARDPESSQRPVAKAKASSETTAVAPTATKAQKNAKITSALPAKKTAGKALAKPTDDLAVFDIPMSDEEAPPTVKKISRQAPQTAHKEPPGKSKTTSEESHKDTTESDESNASNKRKRKGSMSSTATVATPVVQQTTEQTAHQRSRKVQKNEESASPGHASLLQPVAGATRKTQPPALALNKPTRTRQRTVPVMAPRKMVKGQSSPATLSGMIPNRQAPRPSPVKKIPDVPEMEDETMYDIPDPLTTPVRKSRPVVPGSVTPRQRDLFSGLLSDSSSSATPMPSLANLQLTDRKPRSLIGNLARSKSDVTHSAKARKSRLIDTLKPTETSSDDDEEDSSSDGGEESEASSKHPSSARRSVREVGKEQASTASSDDMDVDKQANVDSQTSQTTSGFGMRPKLTYAMARSYLKEDNPEDDLLISMDLDDGFGSQSQMDTRSVSEDDPEQNSQAQAQQIHELKTRGRNMIIGYEIEMMIGDISVTNSKSMRRSAMIDLCTKMADETFCHQLVDSALAHQFFQNIAGGREIIFDFVAAVATVFILRTNPTHSVLDELQETGSFAHLIELASIDADIKEIAKDRKSNMSKIAKESVFTFRTLVQQSSIWSSSVVQKISPQLVALKAIELLIIGMRKAGNADKLLDQTMISQLVEIASISNDRLQSGKEGSADKIQASWPTGVLQRIAGFMPRFFQPDSAASTMLAVRLCMNLTNNKPKACQPFSAMAFVQPLTHSIVGKFESISTGLATEKRTEVLDSLILSLGASINLAELSDEMRLNVADQIDALVAIFLEGSKRASQAASMEESHSGVAIGYLAVLLGNLSLNDQIRAKVRTLLPNKRLDTLVDSIKEFVRVHQHVDQKAGNLEGTEGQEALQSYTARLMLVVERLQNAST
ncbi:uncharacterized protein J4E88_010061 [Alternaria novae-zelandiae]|uniref:uncharacterized protein n=1 Tax=Alternaria novae-zelandiae TaxID=430562 RepID=UPI0020C52268|nr:uncharacterized protein J4E88_010061 [Alternaria novae-zelandiae]KAI4667810.1 hypothetical protein J4E88_010061 [Alternaria novae-zelandiae]